MLSWNHKGSHVEATKQAVFGAGAGVFENGKYVQVAFQAMGQGQFMPVAAAGANPHEGTVDRLEYVLEYKVEVQCEGREVAKKAVEALKLYVQSSRQQGGKYRSWADSAPRAHPYEVPAYAVFKAEDF
jgi:hypothetical protein